MAAGWDSWCGSLKHTNSKLCGSARDGTRRILSDHDHDHTPDVPVPVSFVSEALNPNIVIASFQPARTKLCPSGHGVGDNFPNKLQAKKCSHCTEIYDNAIAR
jgi:hypothetical protein